MNSHKTRTNGSRSGLFGTTHWTEILTAQSAGDPQGRQALEALLARYWKSVYCYLRCKGYDTENAKDLTQGFFHEVVLGRGLIQKADRSRGRFRTFLLTCLNHYVWKIRRSGKARSDLSTDRLIYLGEMDKLNVPEPCHYTTPNSAFDYAWGTAILDQVIAEVAAKCRETGNAVYWDLFRERFLQPVMENARPPALPILCQKYGVTETAKASHMILTVKRRFRGILRSQVRQFVSSDAEVDEEIRYLMRLFSRRNARL